MKVKELEVLSRESFGEGGFFRLVRYQVQNRRADGTHSRPYGVDLLDRPCGTDAVAVIPYERNPDRVLLRRALRPVVYLARHQSASPAELTLLEAVAGILERHDPADGGVQMRAAAELREEAGIELTPESIELLGAPLYMSPGVMAERVHFCAAAVSLDDRSAAIGDGSPMEEGGSIVILTLHEALEYCDNGVIVDLKTECIVRRLAHRLQGQK